MAWILTAAILASGCASTPATKFAPAAAQKAAHSAPPPAPEPAYDYSGRIKLSGNLLTAPPLKVMALAVVPFGRDANAIFLEKQKGGVQFQIALESCSENGCIIEGGDVQRIIVARLGVADAIPLGFIDPEWRRNGMSSISEKGWLALPMGMTDNSREIWILDERFRLHKRIPHKIISPPLLQWRGDDLFIIFQGQNSGIEAKRVNLETGTMMSASPIDPWWPDCADQSSPVFTTGWNGGTTRQFDGRQVIPMWKKGDSRPMALEFSEVVHPMTGNGLASPIKIAMDCAGRICLITALGEDTWCMRFSADGALEAATHISGNIAGDSMGIQIDRRGRFFYLETILEQENPEKIHLIRLE